MLRTQHLARRWCFWDWRRRVAVHASVASPAASVHAWVASAATAPAHCTADAHLVNVHLGAGVRVTERVRQAALVTRGRWYDAIVAGDLNDDPDSAPLRALADGGLRDSWSAAHPDATHPPTNWEAGPRDCPPTQRLDYVLVPEGVVVVGACVPDDWRSWAGLSDHLPVVARLRVPSP